MDNLFTSLFLFLFIQNTSSQGIATIDFVKIQDGRTAEAQFYYTQNWSAFRAQAQVSGWISDYQILEADHSEWDLILISNYSDSIQFKAIEERFTRWQEQSPLQLLNDLKPNEFRKNMGAITTNSKTLSLPDTWRASDKCNSEHHRAFDFWLGTWDVTLPDGKPAGRNTIKPIQGGCVLHEDWVSANGVYKGTSYNFYNASTGKWNQSWIDNQGGVLQMSGGIKDDNMVMSTLPIQNFKGEMQTDKITWIPKADGTVEQIWEKSLDNGKTWTVVFHGIYTKET